MRQSQIKHSKLPSEWPDKLLDHIQHQVRVDGRTVVVLDDDPTGTQTVANIPVLTEWSVAALKAEIIGDYPAFYILTNTRSFPEAQAVQINQEIGQNLVAASHQTGRDFVVVSRSDSTLRGHFPAEPDALAAAFQQPFDGCLIIPCFLEGGRFTINDIHYVQEGDRLIPAAETPFAKDSVFGYRSSNLKDWVAEKSNGRIQAKDVLSISLDDIRQGGPEAVKRQLSQVNGQYVIVNALTKRDLEVFTYGLLLAEAAGKRFLYRTAASFVQVRAGLAPTPLLTTEQLKLPANGGGLIVAGSYVPKTTRQIERLLADTAVHTIAVEVDALLEKSARQMEIARVTASMNSALAKSQDVAIYTSRKLVKGQGRTSLDIGQQISTGLVQIIQNLTERPRYIVAKGGITSSDIATKALNVRRAVVAGQILPGVPVWKLDNDSCYPGLAYVVFPGNVGGDDALVQLLRKLTNEC